ncbi:jg7566, partial [Pararge aegeria aegeria]
GLFVLRPAYDASACWCPRAPELPPLQRWVRRRSCLKAVSRGGPHVVVITNLGVSDRLSIVRLLVRCRRGARYVVRTGEHSPCNCMDIDIPPRRTSSYRSVRRRQKYL